MDKCSKFIDKSGKNDIIERKLCFLKGNRMKKNNKREIVQAFSMVLQFGINMLVPIALCTVLGVWLGDKYNMDWIVIPFFFIGALAGYTSIYKMVKGFLKDKDTKKEKDVKKN